ncbi:HNH endonuclease [Dietzia psychralcaliphila]|uniref:HNH endonuclease n=1 Tax=Dietzia psychralcaliphila TaxID=139021 RepID=UPI001C1E13AC|nr:HNH endonuclease [Dietzia psychralcaliphila]
MATRIDGSSVAHDEALDAWALAAYHQLHDVARTYNRVITYRELRDVVHTSTGITTNMLLQNWIGTVLEKAAERAVDASEPPLTSLCVRADGTIGDGYTRAPKVENASVASDIEVRAAEDRLLCYRKFAVDLPEDGGMPTLTPEVIIQRRKQDDSNWLDQLIRRGTLSVRDRIPFSTHVQVAELFGRSYKGHQSATIRLDEFTSIWFPKMYPNEDWDNSQSEDGNLIIMQPVADGRYAGIMESEPIRRYVITFGHNKPTSGSRFYQFLGVYEVAPQLSNSTKWVHQRVSSTVTFDGSGAFSFDPQRTRPVQDDQTSEAADSDPVLVADYLERLKSGTYLVEDTFGRSKVRGSAQAAFAKIVKGNYEWECAVTGIATPEFLVASHIVPWSEDTKIRLDPSNGICLSTFIDRAFDAGFLTITPERRTAVRWDKVQNDPILRTEFAKIDDVVLAQPLSSPPDPTKLARRIELGY